MELDTLRGLMKKRGLQKIERSQKNKVSPLILPTTERRSADTVDCDEEEIDIERFRTN